MARIGRTLAQFKRRIVQWLAALLFNANLTGFSKGKIYTGSLKHICVPGLNCYSCPGALGSCPIGSLQAVFNSIKTSVSYYVTGTILLFGIALGRFICGWLCPFGLFQEILYHVPLKKRKLPSGLKYIKYGVLVIFVLILPILVTDAYGSGTPFFCKYICPAGTLEGGIPLLALNSGLRASVDLLFYFKFSILIVITLLACSYFRIFCRVLCPLGAIYGLLNRFSFYQYQVDTSKCTHCHKCAEVCPLDVDIVKCSYDPECIRCGQCQSKCPTQAISTGFKR